MCREYLQETDVWRPKWPSLSRPAKEGRFLASAHWREFLPLLTQGSAFLPLPLHVCSLLVFWDRVYHSPGWPWTLYVTQDDLVTMILPFLPPYAGITGLPYHTHFYVVLEIKARPHVCQASPLPIELHSSLSTAPRFPHTFFWIQLLIM